MQGPIKKIPQELINLYTLNGKIPVYDSYFEENNKNKIVWSNKLIKDIEQRYTKENIINKKLIQKLIVYN